jgi:hypothetical protein
MILGFVFSCIATKLTFRARRIAHAKIAGPIHRLFKTAQRARTQYDASAISLSAAVIATTQLGRALQMLPIDVSEARKSRLWQASILRLVAFRTALGSYFSQSAETA